MRTTVRIDDDLYRSVKSRAATEGRTVAAVLEDAVRIGMATTTEPPGAPYRVRAHGSGGVLAGIDLSSNAALDEVLGNGLSIEQTR